MASSPWLLAGLFQCLVKAPVPFFLAPADDVSLSLQGGSVRVRCIPELLRDGPPTPRIFFDYLLGRYRQFLPLDRHGRCFRPSIRPWSLPNHAFWRCCRGMFWNHDVESIDPILPDHVGPGHQHRSGVWSPLHSWDRPGQSFLQYEQSNGTRHYDWRWTFRLV